LRAEYLTSSKDKEASCLNKGLERGQPVRQATPRLAAPFHDWVSSWERLVPRMACGPRLYMAFVMSHTIRAGHRWDEAVSRDRRHVVRISSLALYYVSSLN